MKSAGLGGREGGGAPAREGAKMKNGPKIQRNHPKLGKVVGSHIPSLSDSWILGRTPNFGVVLGLAEPCLATRERIVQNAKNSPQKEAFGTLHPAPDPHRLFGGKQSKI